eukprot:c29111_g1_i2 orf=402-3044(-)
MGRFLPGEASRTPSSVAAAFFLLGFLFFFGSLLALAASFVPADNYLLDCGSATNSSVNGLQWVGDVGSAYLAVTDQGAVANTTIQNDNLPSTVPFLSARIFRSRGTYSFPVTPGRHWIRLYFYPFSYQNFDPRDAVLTVQANGYTLISNMTLVQEMEALNLAYIYKEFSLNVTSSTFTINFIPGSLSNSYAIINGLEVVSVPDELYSESLDDITVGQTISFPLQKIALETLVRLNVGGQPIPPSQDELTREWVNDLAYIPGAAVGVAGSTSAPIEYGSVENYTAPVDVYNSARYMTNDNNVNLNFNLTWLFSVDPNFSYYIRLHFCELQYSKPNQRVFNIYINNQTARLAYDVVAAAGGEDIANILDFSATLLSENDFISIQLAPYVAANQGPQYYNAILNGLEIFKMNDTRGNLQGRLHIYHPVPSGSNSESGNISTSSHRKWHAIGGAAGAVSAVALVMLALCCFCRHQKVTGHSGTWLSLPFRGGNSHSMTSKVSAVSHKSGTGSCVSSVPSNLCRYFSFAEILEMTNRFDEARVLGVGGFGKVYQGVLDDGTKVAVKRGNPCSEQGIAEFQTEIEMLSKLRHRHLVSLIGYCEEHSEMILVYDYMSNGPLRGHLYGTSLPPLSWKQRLEICIGAARGLHYLHTGAAHGIIHRDVKTTNILLDENFVAKVADFGLSKTGPTLDHTHVSTAVKGSFGYLDPEYFRRQQLTEKSDVYSFGVVLMEVVCARPVINPTLPREQVNLAEWAMHWQKKGLLEQIIDPYLMGRISKESLKKFGEIAEKCLEEQGIDRPTMGDVLWNLEYGLQLHETSEEKDLDESIPQVMEMPLRFMQGNDLDDSTAKKDYSTGNYGSGTHLSEDSDDVTASAVFSQLVNPQGR